MTSLSDVAREKLTSLNDNALRRELKIVEREDNCLITHEGKPLISFSCNDYLGMSQHEKVKEAAIKAIEKYGAGAGASRLVTGNHPLYAELEQKIARWKGFEAALVVGSGYLANIGVIPALVGKGDLIIADRLVHACLIDGAKLSGAKLLRFKHNNLKDCKRILTGQRKAFRHCLIITDEVFSMDGDIAPLTELARLAKQHNAWLMADGAHGLTKLSAEVDIYVGTLSKTLGSYGGYICARKDVIDYIINSARSFIFSTALPPSAVAAANAALDLIRRFPEMTLLPLNNARFFTEELGLPLAESSIVPLILGDEKKALIASAALAEAGYLAVAIRPPTVPKGTSRLRFAFSALHKKRDILAVAEIAKTFL